MGEEIDFATSAQIGFAALLDRIDLILERGTVSYDDYNDIEDIADAFRSPGVRLYYDELNDLAARIRALPLGATTRFSVSQRMGLEMARHQGALVEDALNGWRKYEAGIRARQPQFNPGVDSFMDWLICSGLIQNFCIGVGLKAVGDKNVKQTF